MTQQAEEFCSSQRYNLSNICVLATFSGGMSEMSDRCVEFRGRDLGLSKGVDLVAARRVTRSMSKAIKVCLHLVYFDLLDRV